MATSRSSPVYARFDQFEVDLSCKELRKSGARVPVQDQPFQLLQLLLDAEGKVVTREQLRNALWSAETFVDFEHSVNVAIGKLRHALGDSSDDPKFIETLPKQGYRFIVPVEWVPEICGSEGLHIVVPVVRTGPYRSEIKSKPIGPYRSKRKATIAAAVCISSALALYPWIAPRIERLLRLYELQQLTVVPLTTLPGFEYSPTFSPDGSQVAFVWDEGRGAEGFDLYVKVIGTDKPLRLTHHGGVGRAAWSPDGRNIAFWRRSQNDSGVFLISPLGGLEHKVTSAYRFAGGSLSWSPDGKQLAFLDRPADPPSDDTFRLYVLSLDSMERVLVKTDCGLVHTPAFSPRGDYLAWSCADNMSAVSIHLQRLSDGSVTQLLQNLDGVGGLAWSTDGRRILFSTGFSAGDLWEVALARPGHPEKLPIGHDASGIAVSPKGNKVAFAQTSINTNIWRVDLSDPHSHAQKVVASSREQIEPRYSPDGTQIAFGSNRAGSGEIWVSDSDGSDAIQLTSLGARQTGSPSWSPDGKLIAFDSRAGGEANIYIVNPLSSVPKKLNIDIRGNCVPEWSHDGKWIYFINGADAHHTAVWKVPSEGGHAVQVAQHPSTNPAESPDGKYVYFTRNRWLWRVNNDGSGEQQVQGMPQLSGQSDRWTPFGSGIYFVADEPDRAEIDFFDLDTKKIQLVSVLDKHPPEYMGGLSVSSDGRWLLYAQLDEQASDLTLVENWH